MKERLNTEEGVSPMSMQALLSMLMCPSSACGYPLLNSKMKINIVLEQACGKAEGSKRNFNLFAYEGNKQKD